MLKWLLDLFVAGRLAAKEVCACAWHCKDAKLGVQHLALDPRKKGQNHARFLDSGLGLAKFTQTAVLWEDVPMFDKYNMDTNDGRDLRPLPIVLPHCLVQKVAATDPDAFTVRTDNQRGLTDLPRFRECSARRLFPAARRSAYITLYADAAPWTKTDTMYNILWSDGLLGGSGQRYLICTIRKSQLCRCGC